MKCEKCGVEIDHLIISVFDTYGADYPISVDVEECEHNAVVLELIRIGQVMNLTAMKQTKIYTVRYVVLILSKTMKYKYMTWLEL